MNADSMAISIQLAYALGAWERGEPGAEARHQALLERLKRMAKDAAPGGRQPCRQHLRLVHDDGSASRTQRNGASDSKIDRAKDQLKLTLVDPIGTESMGAPK